MRRKRLLNKIEEAIKQDTKDINRTQKRQRKNGHLKVYKIVHKNGYEIVYKKCYEI